MAAKLCCSAFTTSIRRRRALRHGGADGGLVDRVARKLVELVGEQVRRNRWVARRERRGLTVELDADEPVRRLVLKLDRAVEPRAQPACEQMGLCERAGDLDRADAGDLGPEGGEHRAPTARPRP